MRKRYISKTYLRGVSDWDFVLQKRKSENYYLTIKRINEIDTPFVVDISGKNITYMDNGYYIVEITPLNQFYNVRIFLDKNANVISYYFDISRGNGVEQNIPYYDDLYLDIIYCPVDNNFLTIVDEDELLEAFNTEKITKEEYDFANEVCSKLFEEIKENKNIFVNMDKKELIQRYFN
jgi:predicted RNA-binding protein associated with RNAse of E/G family